MSSDFPGFQKASLVEFLLALPEKDRAKIIDFTLKESRALIDIQRFINERFKIDYSIDEIAEWKQQDLPRDISVTRINLETNRYKGIDEVAALEFQIGQLHHRIQEIHTLIDIINAELGLSTQSMKESSPPASFVGPKITTTGSAEIDIAIASYQDSKAAKKSQELKAAKSGDGEIGEELLSDRLDLRTVYAMLPPLIKEQSSLIEKLNKTKFINNRAELILSGADYVLRVIEKEAAQLPQGQAIVEQLANAAWAAVSAHVGHQ